MLGRCLLTWPDYRKAWYWYSKFAMSVTYIRININHLSRFHTERWWVLWLSDKASPFRANNLVYDPQFGIHDGCCQSTCIPCAREKLVALRLVPRSIYVSKGIDITGQYIISIKGWVLCTVTFYCNVISHITTTAPTTHVLYTSWCQHVVMLSVL